jgi:NSS family neurotransmitter:Na+ symporter
MVGGQVFAIMFYALLFIAALTSMISLLEVVTAYVHETFKLNRTLSAVIITILVIFMAVFASLSCGAMPELALFGKSVFDIFDYISAVILLPLGGMAISIYAGWIIDEKILYLEFARNNKYAMWLFKAYAFALRYIAPVCIFVVFVSSFI